MNSNPNQASSATQKAAILRHLQTQGPIRPGQALREYACMRLGGRIYDLKKDGHNITRKLVKVDSGAYVAEYTLLTN